MNEPWRTGRKVGRTVYQMTGMTPSDEDTLIGLFDSPELAEAAVTAHNQSVLPDYLSRHLVATTADPAQCGQCRRWWPEDPNHPGYADLHVCYQNRFGWTGA